MTFAIALGPIAEGECIYCRGRIEKLTDEHVLPYGLGGRTILPKASCESCRLITHAFETIALRHVLGPGRYQAGIPPRKGKKRPKSWPAYKRGEESNEKIMIPLDEMPFLLWMPTYKTEASFLGELPEDQVSSDEDAFVVITEHPERVGQKLASHGADLVSANIDHLAFARMLAKIALGYCVMTFSRGGFVPIVNPLILGNTDRFRTLVASSQPKEDGFIDPKKFRPELRHEIVHRIVQTGMIQVRITLFANLNGPPYHVLAGVQGNSTLVYRETENGLSVRSLIAQPLIP